MVSLSPCIQAAAPGNILNYSNGLMEYYARYLDKITDKECEETYIVMYPEKYGLNLENAKKKKADMADIRAKIDKKTAELRKGSHTYSILLRVKLGKYDSANKGFPCRIVEDLSCITYRPFPDDADPLKKSDKQQAIVTRAYLFNKVNEIELFFLNPGEFTILKYPEDKADQLAAGKFQLDENKNFEVFVRMNVQILPGLEYKYKKKLQEIAGRISVRGLGKEYLMLARIESIEVYNDETYEDKIGDVGSVNSRAVK